ncbi:MAG: ABC transporter permease [Alphaproteobacteria bacterium]|nr:ABC transporter permease [Alphaproteobacteria bacterium]
MMHDFIAQFVNLVPTGILQALILAIVTMGVMIPFRLLNFADLTSEGAYPLGGAVCAAILTIGLDPISATLIACFAGGLIGLCTAYLHIKYKVNTILAGIILSTMVYSLNLRFMGKPNIHLFNEITLFNFLGELIYIKIIALLTLNILIFLILYRFLMTQKGLRFRAVGLNPFFAEKIGASLTFYILTGLFISNALNGFGGALMVQMQHYADIGMGVGIVIHALAALMIGETILGTDTIRKQLLAPLVGALIYEQIRGIAISLGLPPSDHKFVTGLIVIAAIALKNRKQHVI